MIPEYIILLKESNEPHNFGDDVPYLAQAKEGKGEVYKKEDVEPLIKLANLFIKSTKVNDKTFSVKINAENSHKILKLLKELREKI